MDGFGACFEGIKDPRTGNAGRHKLLDILMIALCTVLCGGQTAVDMAEFAEAKEEFLREFPAVENEPPSHDTFSRLFRLFDPDQFGACFRRFMAEFTSRRSFDRASGKSALHMVSAWGCDQRLVLAQIATDEKSNEITAVPKLLEMLSLKGTIVTVDALNCQRDIAGQIVGQDGDYALALKCNQGALHADVRLFLEDPHAAKETSEPMVEADHGRPDREWTTLPRIWPSCDTWRSISCAKIPPKDHSGSDSTAPLGTTSTSPGCLHSAEM